MILIKEILNKEERMMKALEKILMFVLLCLFISGIIAHSIVEIWKFSDFVFVAAWIIIFVIILACKWFLFIKSTVIDRIEFKFRKE